MRKYLLITTLAIIVSGCVSVPMEDLETSNAKKQFNSPTQGYSGLYIYRNSFLGGALKKDVYINGKCLGQTAPDVFFYEEVKGNKEYKISTESEIFGDNDIALKAESGKNYFIRQYIKPGLVVGGADLELVSEQQGKKDVSELSLAKKGECGETQ